MDQLQEKFAGDLALIRFLELRMVDMMENADTMKHYTKQDQETTYKKMLGLADLRKLLSDEPEDQERKGGLRNWTKKILDRG